MFPLPSANWSPITHQNLSIRDQNYLSDGKKVGCHPPLLRVDTVWVVGQEDDTRSSYQPLLETLSPDSHYLILIFGWRKIDIACIMTGSSKSLPEHLCQIIYQPDTKDLEKQFKIIPYFNQGLPLIIRKPIHQTPFLLGKRITLGFYPENDCRSGRDSDSQLNPKYRTIRMPLADKSNRVVSSVLCMIEPYLSKLDVEIGFLLEGINSGQLPERLLAGIRFKNLNLAQLAAQINDDGPAETR